MKKMLFLTILFIAVPSFFIFNLEKKETNDIESIPVFEEKQIKNISIRVNQVSKNKIIEIEGVF